MLQVTIKVGDIGPITCYPSPQELLRLLASSISGEVEGNFAGFAFGGNQPIVEEQDRPWLRVYGSGAPWGWFTFFNGHWRPVPNAKPGFLQFISLGLPLDGLFDETGLGLIDTDYDGWAITNGANGTPDLRGKFLQVAGEVASTTAAWGLPGSTGGAVSVTLNLANLPELGMNYDKTVLPGSGNTYSGGTHAFQPPQDPGFQSTHVTIKEGPAEGFPILPPYTALLCLMFVGYDL